MFAGRSDLERVGIEALEVGASLLELGIQPPGRCFVVLAILVGIDGVAFGRVGRPPGSPEGFPGHHDRV